MDLIKKIMKRFLLAPLIIGLIYPLRAEETCMFVSQYQKDLTIEVSTKYALRTKGYIKYKSSPIFDFSTNIFNKYGGQFFSIGTISNALNNKEKTIVSGSVVTVVGDQIGTKGTPEDQRKKGQKKLFFPNFALNYASSLFGDEIQSDASFDVRTEKVNAILRAAEGFWIPSEICKKYVLFGW